MCGIAGIARFRGEGDDLATVERMLDHLEARGPDDTGVVKSECVVLGNRRLAILDLSPAGHQPMRSPSGRFWITFNGEIYNHHDVRAELGVDPRDLRSGTDTEVILRAWERWGVDCLQHFAGQWAMALYDAHERRLWLARDRFGEKPLYYHDGPARLVFASSLGALLEEPETPRELDLEALREYVSLRYVVAPRTVLGGVRKLPGGSWKCVAADGSSEERVWFTPRFRSHPRRRQAELVEEFDALFTRAAERTLLSDVPVALLLSDGIDSNAVRAALVARGRVPPSFTFRLADAGGDVPPAAVSPADGGAVHDLVVTRGDRMSGMDRAFGALTEPVGDGAALATWMLIRAAREHATVFLCGHGGDEVLGGYRLSQDRFRLALLHRLSSLPLAWIGGPLERFLYGEESLETRRARFREAPAEKSPAAARYLVHRPRPAADVRRLCGPAPAAEPYLATVDRLYAACDGEARDLDRMQEVMLRTFLSENILSFADSVAMDSSAELRMPFLDRDLVEFVFSLPRDARVGAWPGRTNTKRILRWWARGRVPEDVLRRRKRGFQYGLLSDLLRSEAPALRERVLGARALRRALPGVESWLARPPDAYRGPWEGTLWSLLALGIWCEASGL